MERRDDSFWLFRNSGFPFALCVWLSLCSPTPAAIAAEPPVNGPISYEPFPIESFWGPPIVRAELGRLRVPENRASGSHRAIELAFVRIPSTAERPGAPIVWLSGGPGASGTADLGTPALQLLLELRRLGDVIVLDQRGTGLSVPRLECPGRIRLPFDVPTDRVSAIAALEAGARSCAEHWRREGVDLSAYNVRESAEDLEDLRVALGASKLRLLASSWGTHLALAAIRLHQERLDRAALVGVVGPDHLSSSPDDVELELVRISQAARRDPKIATRVPDLIEGIRGAIDRLSRAPQNVDLPARDGGILRIAVGGFDLAWYTRSLLSSEETIAHLPAFLTAVQGGDLREVAIAAAYWRSAQTPPASVFAARCASGASPERVARIARARATAALGETTSYAEGRICKAFGVPPLPDSFRAPVRSPVPALFVSGSLDGGTPEENAIEVSRGFPNGERLLVENAPHQLLGFGDAATRNAIVQFLEGGHLRTTHVSLPRIVFERPETRPVDPMRSGIVRDATLRSLPSFLIGGP